MHFSPLRSLVLVACSSTMVMASPSESYAIFDWLQNLFGGCCGTSCCSSNYCAAPVQQQCNYVPQTCYRNVTVNVPVTTYRPVTTTDPCTGCPQTCMKPVQTCVRQTRRVPYTTYRMVCNAAPTCNTCAMPVATGYAPAPSGCSSCQAGGAMPMSAPVPSAISQPPSTYSQPPTTYAPSPAPAYPSNPGSTYAPAPGAVPPSSTVPPSLNTQPTPRTYQEPETRLRPVPDPSMSSPASPTSGEPMLVDPAARTAQNWQVQPWQYTPVRWPEQSVPRQQIVPASSNTTTYSSNTSSYSPTHERLDDSGWGPALR